MGPRHESQIEDALQQVLSKQPSQFRFLKELLIRRQFGAESRNALQLRLVLVGDARPEAPELSIEFENVTDLKIGETNGIEAVVLAVRPIRERGWEDLNYRVTDEENGLLAFFCRAVRLTGVDAAGRR
ncbi:MAG TPA: hypothetical protein VGK67_14290 [Myxococcales bacterium]|jgi:hypothetical protein